MQMDGIRRLIIPQLPHYRYEISQTKGKLPRL